MGWMKRVSDAAEATRENLRKLDEQKQAAARPGLVAQLERASKQWSLPSVLRTYDAGGKQERLFAEEAEIFDGHGYDAMMQDADGGHVHVGRLLLTGGLSMLAGRKGIRSKGKMTVTFRKRSVAAGPAPIDTADQIGKLAALRDQGILTEEEFQAKKAQLLA